MLAPEYNHGGATSNSTRFIIHLVHHIRYFLIILNNRAAFIEHLCVRKYVTHLHTLSVPHNNPARQVASPLRFPLHRWRRSQEVMQFSQGQTSSKWWRLALNSGWLQSLWHIVLYTLYDPYNLRNLPCK